MTHQDQERARESSSPSDDAAVTRRALRADLRRLGQVGSAKLTASTTTLLKDHAVLDGYAATWVPLAERRRESAAGSESDQARWSRLIEAATRPPAPTTMTYETLVVRIGYTRDLLRALRDTLPPWVPIIEVAQQIKKRIAAGAYPPGVIMAPGRVATDLSLPIPSVRLALVDLAAKGVIEQHPNGRVRVPGAHLEQNRPTQLALIVLEFVQSGVFPPGAALPERSELCRILVTGQKPLSAALHRLFAEGVLEYGDSRRPTVRPDAAKRSTAPVEIPSPAPHLALSTDETREAVRRARGWWNARLFPAPEALDRVISQLVTAAHHLVEHARCGPLPPTTTHQQVSALIARTAVMAAAVRGPDYPVRVWHTACLATAVGDLAALVGISRPTGATVPRSA
ncbi:hypothetical protein ABT112_02005 [Streptomyces sp. NPDC002055]|uniref:hypothetical protein n=1 Tax=Streptomyces sp. NPDC002055 TaxID=3154534 RepID=UPI00332169CF